MFVVGLTGGIGSGKSTVAELLAHHGAGVLDADVIAREVIAPGTAGFDAIVARFGREVLDASGGLDRAALASVVFSDDDALADLNGIVHPMVRTHIVDEVDAVRDVDGVLLLVVPLLVESGAYPTERVIVVDCDEEVALARLMSDRGWSLRDAKSRMRAQATREQRRSFADLVVDNSGSLKQLGPLVDHAWAWIVAEAGASLAAAAVGPDATMPPE